MVVGDRGGIAVDVELPPPGCEGLVLIGGEVPLVAEHEHLVGKQRLVDGGVARVVDSRQVEAHHLGADRRREPLEGERGLSEVGHDPSRKEVERPQQCRAPERRLRDEGVRARRPPAPATDGRSGKLDG